MPVIVEKPIVEGSGYVCGCCGLPYAGTIQWDHNIRLCQQCVSHRDRGEMEKHGAHRRSWAAWSASIIARLDAEKRGRVRDRGIAAQAIAELQTENRDLRDALRDGVESLPAATVAEYFETDAVREALSKRDAAYRQRDYSMQTLWRIDQRHHAVSEKKLNCSCGHAGCDLPRLMEEEVQTLRKWDKAQSERAREGKDHHLPPEHPVARQYPSRLHY